METPERKMRSGDGDDDNVILASTAALSPGNPNAEQTYVLDVEEDDDESGPPMPMPIIPPPSIKSVVPQMAGQAPAASNVAEIPYRREPDDARDSFIPQGADAAKSSHEVTPQPAPEPRAVQTAALATAAASTAASVSTTSTSTNTTNTAASVSNPAEMMMAAVASTATAPSKTRPRSDSVSSHSSMGLTASSVQSNSTMASKIDKSNPLKIESSDDDEIRKAKEMVLAMQQNANMAPDQLRKFNSNQTSGGSSSHAMHSFRSNMFKKPAIMGKLSGMKILSSMHKDEKQSSTHDTANPSSANASGTQGYMRSSQALAHSMTKSMKSVLGQSSHSKQPVKQHNSVPTIIPEAVHPTGSPAHSLAEGASVGPGIDRIEIPTSRSVDSVTSYDEQHLSPQGASMVSPNEQKVRISGIAWKRRSGLGKYSTTGAWERRRFALIGSVLNYYRSRGNDSNNNDQISNDSEHEAPRGHLHLLKDEVSAGASLGHSGAPTPFALSIKTMGQTKWKICFDTHMELMQWLAALTDVIVQGSVDSYNAQLLMYADPTSGGEQTGKLREPDPDDVSENGTVGHRLWTTGAYSVRNCDESQFRELEHREFKEPQNEPETKTHVENVRMGANETATESTSSSTVSLQAERNTEHTLKLPKQTTNNSIKPLALPAPRSPEPATPMYGFPEERLTMLMIALNVGLFAARSSFTSIGFFWTVVTTLNMVFIRALTKFTPEQPSEAAIISQSHLVPRDITTTSSVLSVDSVIGECDVQVVQTISPTTAATTVVPIAKKAFKPVAGTSSMKIQNTTDPPVRDGHTFAGWRTPAPDMIQVRSHGYGKTKKKVSSPGELYKCIHADIFESKRRCPDMASRVVLPKVKFADEDEDDGVVKTWNAPDLFVVSVSLPTDPPKLTGSSVDGGGYVVTLYFAMCQDTRDILRRITADGYDRSQEDEQEGEGVGGDVQKSKVNAVRLFDEWCRRAPTDDSFMTRFKVVPNAQNLAEIGLPSWIAKYNGKPFLIKRPGQTGFLYRHAEHSCMEFDISLHPFPYIAKKGICFMKDRFFKKVVVTFAFVIEGRADDELPECIIGLMQLCYPDPVHAIQAVDFFSGKSNRSFEPTQSNHTEIKASGSGISMTEDRLMPSKSRSPKGGRREKPSLKPSLTQEDITTRTNSYIVEDGETDTIDSIEILHQAQMTVLIG